MKIVQIADDDRDAPAAGKTILEHIPVRSPRDFVTPKLTFQQPAGGRDAFKMKRHRALAFC
jgi:hypothetical protein